MERLVILPSVDGLQEYSLVIEPATVIVEKLAGENNMHSVPSKPLITLATFQAKEAMEETIIRYMQRILSTQQVFNITLNNYSGIPPHTIFVRIQNQQPFRQISSQLIAVSEYVSSCSCPPIRFHSQPHLPVVQQVNSDTFLDVLFEYSQKSFHESFTVDRLLLVKRSHAYEANKPVHVFSLCTRAAYSPEQLYAI